MHAIQFGALGDATRCRLIEMLSERPLPVHTLTEAFSISRPAISRHLRVLKEAGLVIEEKQGRENVYRLLAGPLEPLRTWLAAIEQGGKAGKRRKAKPAAVVVEAPAPVAVEPVVAVVEPAPVVEIQPVVVAAPIAAPEPKPAPVVAAQEIAPEPKPRKKAKSPAVPEPDVNQMAWEF